MIPASRHIPRAILFSVLLPFLGIIHGVHAQAVAEDNTLLAEPTISTAATGPSTEALAVALDTAMDKAIYQNRTIGAVVMVSQDGKVIYQRAAGLADRENKIPMRKDSLFRFSSVTKAFTSMAAAALIQQGKLQLDDPVTKWLPEFKPALPNGEKPVITIRQLMTHTAGLNYSFFEKKDEPYHRAGVSDGLDNSTLTLEENLLRIASAPLLFTPGTKWNYSLATDVLGAVVARANGTTLPEAIQVLVTAPLGMKDAGFVVTDKYRLTIPYFHAPVNPADMLPNQTLIPNPVPPLKMGPDELVSMGEGVIRFSPGRIMDANAFPSGGAGMVGSAKDVLTLIEVMRKGGEPITNPELMQAMTSNQIGQNRVSPGVGFGMGWAVIVNPAQAQTPQSAGTFSWGGVYGHSWFVDPGKKLSMVIMTNTAYEGMSGKLVTDVRDAIYANLP